MAQPLPVQANLAQLLSIYYCYLKRKLKHPVIKLQRKMTNKTTRIDRELAEGGTVAHQQRQVLLWCWFGGAQRVRWQQRQRQSPRGPFWARRGPSIDFPVRRGRRWWDPRRVKAPGSPPRQWTCRVGKRKYHLQEHN